ncbi:polysaccharide lyase family 8 protein [Macrolepiota fuliginosa MF-IS2]|uniref:Polysaccharide lyase family 8 protein n=1 Tax=Macrolepiota fuliginosa MF-IS2 TaxID=1400762 RepID=A0A9P5XLM5_9AGAR|nr:polysaccharide lyase family 8 protein [Macrolepiota fuliginosa MF-IS2]
MTGTTTTTATTSTSTTSASQPTQTVDPETLRQVQLMQTRRLSNIVGPLSGADNISAWLSSLGADGKWPDSEVDYTTGCPARRANWPAQEHWQRLLTMAAAWHGGLKGGEQFVKDDNLHSKISLAMDYWFGRDITNLNCLINGGTSLCPCDNPDNTLWNTNWFSNVILIPELAGETCLLLNDTLTETQFDHCTNMTGRSYNLFLRPFNEVTFLTGANTLDVAKIGTDEALLNLNVTQIADALRRVHEEVVIQEAVKADGIRPDGSFGQHGGVLYNGNYGKYFLRIHTNDIVDFEIETAQTQFAASPESQSALATLFEGDHWMIYRNSLTGVLHWDFSVLGRFISFPVIDAQATESIKLNLTEIGQLGELWNSPIITQFAQSLSADDDNANAGKLVGNRMFYDNDYMVHRGRNYVSTVKMFSSRTENTECTNLQNPLGFHLSDGVHYTYLKGNEYEDISAAWDWNLIPGITTDYGATPLSCNQTGFTGIENFVGGASNGDIGIAVMRYTNPLTKALKWQKVWFFLEDDVQHTMVSNITSTSDKPVYSVLDQRRHDDAIFIDDGQEYKIEASSSPLSSATLWHGGVGYALSGLGDNDTLHVEVGEKTGPWTAIGTSTQPPATVDLFSAWVEHGSPAGAISYSMFPGTTFDSFLKKQLQLRLQTLCNDGSVAAVYDEAHKTVMVVFWEQNGGSVTFTPPKYAPITISTNGNIALIYRFDDAAIFVSDPSQTLAAVEVDLSLGAGRKPPQWGPHRPKSFVISLPTGGLAGSSVRQEF